jgi:hypothetical protein
LLTLIVIFLVADGARATVLFNVGTNINISQSTDDNAEETIAINPLNTNNLFADDTWAVTPRYSLNSGATWANSDVSALPSTEGDVTAVWDGFGNLFLVQFGTSATLTVVVGLSTNGGASFRLLYQTAATQLDQPNVAVGPGLTTTGSVWITYTTSSGAMKAQSAAVTGLGLVGTFSTAVTLASVGDFGDVVIGPRGQVAVVYQNQNSGEGPDSIKFNLDPDGTGTQPFQAATTATTTQVGGFAIIPAQPQRSIDAESGLAWDRSGGAHNGRLYLVYTDRPSTNSYDTDIYVRYSDNSGTNWSARVRVNDDTIGNGKSQFLPRIALDQTTGNIAVSFYDCRNSADNTAAELWAAVSVNGGISFEPNIKVSAGQSSALVGSVASNSTFDYGDYTGLTFHGGAFYPCWADNSNSTGDNPDGANDYFDMYTARVVVTLQEQLLNPRFVSANFVASVKTDNGKTYFLESSPALPAVSWTTTSAGVLGDGTQKDLTATNAANSRLFYRARVQ